MELKVEITAEMESGIQGKVPTYLFLLQQTPASSHWPCSTKCSTKIPSTVFFLPSALIFRPSDLESSLPWIMPTQDQKSLRHRRGSLVLSGMPLGFPCVKRRTRPARGCLPLRCSDANIQKPRLHPFTCPAHLWTYKAVDTISRAITGPFQTISLPLSQSSLYSRQAIPHLQFVYFTDTSIFPANRNKSAFLLWLPIAFTHHLLPSAPAQITIVASSSQSPALTPIQLPKTKTFIFLMGEGRWCAKQHFLHTWSPVFSGYIPWSWQISVFSHTLLICPKALLW